MKVLKSEEFINESVLSISKKIENFISLDSIIINAKWDGLVWNDYERDNKEGTFAKYSSLDANKRKTLEVKLDLNFEQLDENGEYVDDITTVSALATVYFTDMQAGDYDLECKTCTNIQDIVDFLKDNNFENGTPDEIAELIRTTWDEEEIEYQLHNELDYQIHWGGIDNIEGKIKEAVVEKIVSVYSNSL